MLSKPVYLLTHRMIQGQVVNIKGNDGVLAAWLLLLAIHRGIGCVRQFLSVRFAFGVQASKELTGKLLRVEPLIHTVGMVAPYGFPFVVLLIPYQLAAVDKHFCIEAAHISRG